ncbi:uncharacterized protein LOC107270225 [Cephus cinctus]|uniref:Uncharacterized protein LOC107270225 n=1 Tax=Cephus cinctus TaxID=211228 RepID=A0AAJ7FNH3_CEPCN|nr:uncharacterized protein LOC107270225 [Cephus cinctus]
MTWTTSCSSRMTRTRRTSTTTSRLAMTLVLIIGLNAMSVLPSQAASTLDRKLTLEKNDLSEPLSSSTWKARYWEWLVSLAKDCDKEMQVDGKLDSEIDPWREGSRSFDVELKSTSPSVRQVASRLSKKDVFVSRGWGAGGMPFSVLYMSPHNTRNNGPSNGVPGSGLVEPARALPLEHSLTPATVSRHPPNYRLAPRNGASGQPRRQYSIIPQLFVSYGWGPLGR